jgi:hypothetical protein
VVVLVRARPWQRSSPLATTSLDALPDEPSAACTKALDGAGFLAHDQGDDDAAIALIEASLWCAQEIGAAGAAALAAAHACSVRNRVRPAGGTLSGRAGRRFAREEEDDYALAIALNNLGEATRALGENGTGGGLL